MIKHHKKLKFSPYSNKKPSQSGRLFYFIKKVLNFNITICKYKFCNQHLFIDSVNEISKLNLCSPSGKHIYLHNNIKIYKFILIK